MSTKLKFNITQLELNRVDGLWKNSTLFLPSVFLSKLIFDVMDAAGTGSGHLYTHVCSGDKAKNGGGGSSNLFRTTPWQHAWETPCGSSGQWKPWIRFQMSLFELNMCARNIHTFSLSYSWLHQLLKPCPGCVSPPLRVSHLFLGKWNEKADGRIEDPHKNKTLVFKGWKHQPRNTDIKLLHHLGTFNKGTKRQITSSTSWSIVEGIFH